MSPISFQEFAMGYKAEKTSAVHFVTVGVDQEKEHENSDTFYFTFDGEDLPVGSVSSLTFVDCLIFVDCLKFVITFRPLDFGRVAEEL
jgi:hypothetical protein